jgi:hypothetical protein
MKEKIKKLIWEFRYPSICFYCKRRMIWYGSRCGGYECSVCENRNYFHFKI